MKKLPALITIAALALIAILAIQRCSFHKQKDKDSTALLDLNEKKFTQFKTESGKNAGMADARIMDLQTLLALEKTKVARLAKELNLTVKDIKRIVDVQLEGKDTIKLTQVDTIYYPETKEPDEPRPYFAVRPYVFEDRWNYFEAYLNDGEIDINYSITDSIQIVETKSGNTRTFTAFNSNPAIRIKGMQAIVIEEPKARKKRLWWTIPVAVAAGVVLGSRL